ncbi:MAG: DUF924 domain-containing protein [Myxococcales bacterium]|nr:DUF924 domain-containing protein [Myxococcales bacterium]
MEIDAVWDFWFGALDADGNAAPEVQRRWWIKDPALDAEIGARFGALHRAVVGGEREAWRAEPRGALAYVVVLDQFSRNLFRGAPGMFAADTQALAAAKAAVAAGHDRALPVAPRGFFYLPYMHSEDLADQDACVALFTDVPGAAQSVDFAERHRAIVRRFGRFPHRNAILGRASTAEEEAFLREPGSAF